MRRGCMTGTTGFNLSDRLCLHPENSFQKQKPMPKLGM